MKTVELLPDERSALQERLREAELHIAELEWKLREPDSESLNQLQRAERVRVEFEAGLKAYIHQQQAALETYRRQRAWKVMLLLRACYAAAARLKFFALLVAFLNARTGRARLPRRAAESGGALIAALFSWLKNWIRIEELQFPDVQAYLPAETSISFLSGLSSPEKPTAPRCLLQS